MMKIGRLASLTLLAPLRAFLAPLVVVVVAQEDGAAEASPASRRWAATGGGLKAMFANVGIANVLARSDLLTKVKSVSTTSGSSWFSLQFFFSQAFYDVVAGESSGLGDFVTAWMDAYKTIWSNNGSYDCSDIPKILSESYCAVITDFGGNWADFVVAMLHATSASYGELESFANRTLIKSAMVDALAKIQLQIIMSLAPNAQVRDGASVFVGTASEVYTPPVSALFEIGTTRGGGFAFALPVIPTIANGATLPSLSVSDFDGFGLATSPAEDLELTTTPPLELTDNGQISYPFASAATVGQIAAASSANAAMLSPLLPSMYAQYASLIGIGSTETISEYESFFLETSADGLAVCSQYPNACGASDVYLIDGLFADDTSIALDLGNYQQNNNATVDGVTLKYLLVNSDEAHFPLLSLFSTDFNSNVEPGDVIWTIDMAQRVPWRSPQIFADSLDMDTLMSKAEAIEGLDGVSTVLLTATTTNNTAFGIVEGQSVEILVVNVDQDIPLTLFPPADLDAATGQLANMTTSLATSTELLDRIASFYGVDATLAPVAAPPTSGGEPTGPTSLAERHEINGWAASSLLLGALAARLAW